jgi:LPS export ABC transporter protein LptC
MNSKREGRLGLRFRRSRPPRGRRAAARGRLVVACLGLAAACLLAVAGCGRESSGQPESSGTRPDQEIDGFRLTQTQDGERVWTLKAATALIYEDASRVEMSELRIDFYNEDGQVRSTLTADQGTLHQRTNDMQVHGNVVVYAEDGTVLTTELLTWDERTGRIETDRPVRVTKGRDVMTGVGIEADPDLKNIRVKSDFKAFVRSEDGKLIEEE